MLAGAPSSIAVACQGISQFLRQRLDELPVASESAAPPDNTELPTGAGIRVMLGNPMESTPGEGETDPRINLFFYRFEPYGFNADRLPNEIEFLRAYCLVTPFGAMVEFISAGENDLRLLGEVIRIFHQHPVFLVSAGEQQFQIQAIYNPLDMETIMRIWSTQGSVIYRPSVAYEFAVVPVIPSTPLVGSPLVASAGLEVAATLDPPRRPFSGTTYTPMVVTRVVDTRRQDWAPAVCLIYQDRCIETLGLALGTAALAGFAPRLRVAGLPAEQAATPEAAQVRLFWDLWDRQAGWRTVPAREAPVTIRAERIDPTVPDEAAAVAVDLPAGFSEHTGQAVLYAVREYRRAQDGVALTVRSNPILVTVHEAPAGRNA